MNQNINQKSDQAAELLKMLAHPIRLRIALLLSEQAAINVSTFQNLLMMSNQSLISHHLIKMKNRGLLKSVQKGQEIYYSLADSNFTDVVRLLLKIKQS